MRIRVRLPRVEPEEYDPLRSCPHEGCDGRQFKAHGVKGEVKRLRDPHIDQVTAYRWRCLKCGRTFRVYPRGVSNDQQSVRLKALSVLLYALGLSYGAVEDLLWALDTPVAKTTVYLNVQEAGMAARQQQREVVLKRGKRAVIGSDASYVKVKGQEVGVQIVVDDVTGELLGLEIIVSESTESVLDVVRAVAEQVEAEVLVSDDLDSYKGVADALALDHQICRSHVKRNVDALADALRSQAEAGEEPVPYGVDSSAERLLADLALLQWLVRVRPADGEERLEELYDRYKAAPHPQAGQRHTVWYRVRMMITRLWERWRRLTLDQRRDDLDGTNNSSERCIGWWLKEHYRVMRGYKRTESIRNVFTLTASMGAHSGSYDMATLYA
jgi:transposase-like protein